MASHYMNSLSILVSFFCLISLVESYNNGGGGGGVTIDLIHRDSPLSPSHDPSKTRFQRLRNAFDRSFTRHSSLSFTCSLDQTPQAPLTTNGGEYLIEYKIGTPPVRQLSIADTCSDLTWIQCKPCTKCYKQDYPLFNPASTKSYKPVACQTNECAYSGKTIGCARNVCQYLVSYGDQSSSNGELATDTLTLGTNASFPSFVFGCGRTNTGNFKPTASGIFGLGNGGISAVNQPTTSFRGRFSYCLTYPDTNVSSKISFGSNAVVTGPNVLTTPLVLKERDTFYHLTLKGLSVGAQRLKYESTSTTKQQQSGKEGNIIIDSGTTLTFVPLELYKGMETALVKAIKATRVKDPQGTFNLCYRLPRKGEFITPPITAHFKGADVELPQGTTFLEVEKGLVCLTLLPSQNVAIFGNLHQVDYLIGYDVLKKQVSFLKTDCTKPR